MTHTSRRMAITAFGAGIAGLASLSLLPSTTLAAMSGAAGVVAGGSLEGSGGPIQFSAFGTRIEFDDADPVILGSLAWYDPAGADGGPLTISLVSATEYGPDPEATGTARILTGTATVDGDIDYPFTLRLVSEGEIGEGTDTVHLVVGDGATSLTGTPVAETGTGFAYEVEGELTAGNIQIVTLA